MGTIWVREFKSGLDTRRMAEAAAPGVLTRANNGHITRGGEFEQRAAFVPTYTLPDGTVGLLALNTGLLTFGSGVTPAGMPVGVSYQRLQHTDGATALARILSADLYRGLPYVVGEFADGAVFHFYDGARVTDWYDGRSRATFTIVEGGISAAVAATGSFEITGGTAAGAISGVTIDGVSLMSGAVTHTGNNATTATAVAAAINSYSSTPDYTATANGQRVIISAAVTGTAANGKLIVPAVSGDATVAGATTMSGGAVSVPSRVADLRINGVAVISAPVSWSTSNEDMAADIAAAINSYSSTPDYTASAVGNSVSIAASTPGAAPNGFAVSITAENDLVISPASGLVMAGGSDQTATYQPGSFVRTIGQKVYSVSGSAMHFSGVQAPTKWTTSNVGAGFIDMASESSGSEQLIALARYQVYVAVFAARVIQIWYVDPDPAQNKQSQILSNTGTDCPRSVTAFGDADIFYLDESGLRSLKARDSSNAAATSDIGVVIDNLVTEKLASLSEAERQQVTGLIEPTSGRFWLIMRDRVFVFSFFTGVRISAWSTYDTSYENVDGEMVPFEVDDAVVFQRRVYLRSGNTIFRYGGADGDTHDAVQAEAWLPYLDADDPTRKKSFSGIDAALEGEWEISAAMRPTDESAEDKVGALTETTYDIDGRIPLSHSATHISLRFRSIGKGPHKLASSVVHFEWSDGAND